MQALSTLHTKNDSALHKVQSKSCPNFKAKPKPMVIPKGLLMGSKMENIYRCLQLLDHFTECSQGAACSEGEGCRRTKQVLYHHMRCVNQTNCSICDQLRGLCYLHTQCCKKGPGECGVPFCQNGRNIQNLLSIKGQCDEEVNMEDCKEVMKFLEVALKKTSVVEKREEIVKLLKKYPVAASKVLRDIYKVKINKNRQNKVNSLEAPRRDSSEFVRSCATHSRPVPDLYVAHFKIMKEEVSP